MAIEEVSDEEEKNEDLHEDEKNEEFHKDKSNISSVKSNSMLERFLTDSVNSLPVEDRSIMKINDFEDTSKSANVSNESVDLNNIEKEFETINLCSKTEKQDINNQEKIETLNCEKAEETDIVQSIPEKSASLYKKGKASSIRSVSTIPPEEVKQRLKKEQQKKQRKQEKKRITVKGEASAVNRSRRENLDNIKQSSFFDEW